MFDAESLTALRPDLFYTMPAAPGCLTNNSHCAGTTELLATAIGTMPTLVIMYNVPETQHARCKRTCTQNDKFYDTEMALFQSDLANPGRLVCCCCSPKAYMIRWLVAPTHCLETHLRCVLLHHQI
jgi:hypothetical protein